MNARLIEMAERLSSHYYLPSGGDSDDLLQEALVGAWEAERDYRPGDGSLESFAFVCINRKLWTALKAAGRQKHQAHNSAVSLDAIVIDDDEPVTLHEAVPGRSPDPAERFEFMEAVREARRVIDAMTPLQRAAYEHVINGGVYKRRGEAKDKSIDNAVVVARRKLSFLRDAA